MSRSVVFRRPTPQQGRALEVLGHAVEYLVDSYTLRSDGSKADVQAIAILHNASRDVFAECRVIHPLSQRIRNFLAARLTRLFRLKRDNNASDVPPNGRRLQSIF